MIFKTSHTSHGVKITVEVFYQKDYSNPMAHEFMFCYRVTMENNTPHQIQLLTRRWDIFDSNGFDPGKVDKEAAYFELGPQYGPWRGARILDAPDVFHRYVEGEGVVGQNPVIEPGEQYEYVSGANLSEEIGQMSGHYVFKNTLSGYKFKVLIPSFDLITPMKLN